MTNLVSGSKSKSTALNPIRSSNNSNVADFNDKVQNTSLVHATVSEIRPGGDVILASAKGIVRASSKFSLSVGDKVTVRIAYMDDGDTKAHVVTSENNADIDREIITEKKSILMKYISKLISGNDDINSQYPAIFGKFSYMSPNRNLLRYGNINPGDTVKVQILSPKIAKHQMDILAGSVISNDRGVVAINSPLGIINMQTKSDLQPAQKILFRIMNIPNQEQIIQVRDSIDNLMKNIASNIVILKQILSEKRNIFDISSYLKLLQLVTMQHDSATLAKLFHQTRNIPDSDIDRWIKEEIEAPFEAANKGNKLTALSQNLVDLGRAFEEMNIMQPALWRSIHIAIHGTDKEANLKIKNEGNILHFQIHLDHPLLGKLILEGRIELRGNHKHLSSMSLNLKHTGEFPQILIDSISSIFEQHRLSANIEGSIDFIKFEEASIAQ